MIYLFILTLSQWSPSALVSLSFQFLPEYYQANLSSLYSLGSQTLFIKLRGKKVNTPEEYTMNTGHFVYFRSSEFKTLSLCILEERCSPESSVNMKTMNMAQYKTVNFKI